MNQNSGTENDEKRNKQIKIKYFSVFSYCHNTSEAS